MKTRREQILALRGKKSYGLIARELGITRSAVAGIIFRADHRGEINLCSPNSSAPNKIGTGRHSRGKFPRRWITQKLTKQKAQRIKRSSRSASVLAAQYGLHIDTVYKIRRGEFWNNVRMGKA